MYIQTVENAKKFEVEFSTRAFQLYQLMDECKKFLTSWEVHSIRERLDFLTQVFFCYFPHPFGGVFERIDPAEIVGDFVSYTHDNIIFVIIPREEFAHCHLSGQFLHKSQLVEVEEDGETYTVSAAYRVEDLQCPICGKSLLSVHGDLIRPKSGGVFYCSSECALEGDLRICEECGRWERADNGRVLDNDNFYCEDCIDENFRICQRCGEIVHRENPDAYAFDNGDFFCSWECAEYAGYRRCDRCGDITSEGEEIGGEVLCGSCLYEEELKVDRKILAWDYKPDDLTFFRAPHETPGALLYFGTEVEGQFSGRISYIEGINALSEFAEENKGIIYLKHDSTTGQYGVEIVSHPCTLAFHASPEGQKIFGELFDILTDHGFRLHKNCGMHVHMSRNGVTEKQEIAMELMLQGFPSEIETIAERSGNCWCEYPSERSLDDMEAFTAKECDDDRYRAINWCNPRTVEMRIFASVKSHKKYLKNVEFCHAFYQYTKQSPLRNIEGGSFENFLAFSKSGAHKYPNFIDFINRNF